MGKFINPFTDFGFKKLFGTEENKECLLHFINQLLEQEGEDKITSITYDNKEQLGRKVSDRYAVFDIYCITEKGEHIIIELQNAKQKNVTDRSLYYTTFPIQSQGVKGSWDYSINKIYSITILNFTLDYLKLPEDEYLHTIQLYKRENKMLFYDKLMFIYLEMPKFKKREDELTNDFEKWMYFIKNLERLEKIPKKYRDTIFEKMFVAAEIAKLDKMEYRKYIKSKKAINDYDNAINYAREEGKLEGRLEGKLEGRMEGELKGKLEGKLEIVHTLLKMGKPIDEIVLITGLSKEQIEELGMTN